MVAILRLAGTVEREAAALATEFGTLAFDERMKLGAGVPAVVLTNADEARANSLVATLRGRGHHAVMVPSSCVVPASEMVLVRRLALEDDAVVAGDSRLRWSDVATLVRAMVRSSTEKSAVVSERKFDLTRTVVTGGFLTSKATARKQITRTEDSEQILYIFRRDRTTARPWLIRERGTIFADLPQLASTALRNFGLAVDEIRARAPHATFDDRLLNRKCSPEDLDRFAHLIAIGEP